MHVQDHWGKRTIDFILPFFADAKKTVRIATGFFTIQGYDLLRNHLSKKFVYILVGYDETQSEKLREKLIDDILAHLSRWDDQNRRQAVQDLANKLENGEFRLVEQDEEELIEGRIRKHDHGKVYIVDEQVVLIGSTNLTVNGLRSNDESQACIEDLLRVQGWLTKFEAKWNAPDTYDLTQMLWDALKNWLKLRDPYDIYLKTILALVPKDDTKAPRPTYKMPAEFQHMIVERVLRQLEKYHGAMLVASTGLGKTIIATHVCYRLMQKGLIGNVVVFAPKAVQPDWEENLDSAMMNYKLFTRQLLDMQSTGQQGGKLSSLLDKLDDKYLIILDESQYFRNEVRQQGDQRRSFARLIDAVNKKGCFVLLLTATPIARGVEDLNNQLLLLPHIAETSHVRSDGQTVMEGFDIITNPNAWRLRDTENYFEQFIKMPVATVVSTSWVAKNFGKSTAEGDYVDRPDRVGWLPQIEIRKVKIPVPLEEAMTKALNRGFFKTEMQTFKSRGEWQRTQVNVENLASVAWASSPLALEEVIRKTIDGSYDYRFIKSADARRQELSPILGRLSRQTYKHDQKFMALCDLIHLDQGKKFIVFTERFATAVYLEKMLTQEMPELRVASVVKEVGAMEYELKNFENEVYDMILDFAPEANSVEGKREKTYDVLISTDAYSMGVNLQDASVVVNYDLAWTADTLIQRVGRILRFWTRPRKVYVYNFVGDYKYDANSQEASRKIEKRLQQLTLRTREAEKFSELSIIPDADESQVVSLGSLSNLLIENLGEADISQIEEFSGGSPFLSHITELKQNLEYAEGIPDDITSAMIYKGNSRQLYLLIKDGKTYHTTLYDVENEELKSIDEDDLLDLIQCKKQTPLANVLPDEIEELAQKCKALLCEKQGLEPDEVERICALYLIPQSQADDFDEMLRSNLPV